MKKAFFMVQVEQDTKSAGDNPIHRTSIICGGRQKTLKMP